MNYLAFYHQHIIDVLKNFGDTSAIQTTATKNPKHGDFATNAAMVLAQGKNPRSLAEEIVPVLEENLPYVQSISIAGPGFINITLREEFWLQQLKTILEEQEHYGDCNLGQGKKLNIEFISVNPTGPLHAGHGRVTVLGDSICKLLTKAGYSVVREYYINDAGGQIEALAKSVYLRYLECLGQPISEDDFTKDMYGGDYLKPIAQEIVTEKGDLYKNNPNWEELKTIAVEKIMQLIRKDIARLGVEMDIFTSEQSIVHKVEKAIDILNKEGAVYKGALPKPQDHDDDDWEEKEQLLFKSTHYGDMQDRVLKKADNSLTYFSGDIAYHLDKFERGFNNMINIFGADHIGYISRLKAAVKALTKNKATLDIKVCQMVNFLDDGKPVRMSKRAGTFITIEEVVEKVGKDATRFMMLSRDPNIPMDFDFQKVLEQSKDNPIFYIQYAHARICSVKNHASEVFSEITPKALPLTDENELAMIKLIAQWPEQVVQAATTQEPHRITNYLYALASAFHSLWNKGKDNMELRFVDPHNAEKTAGKLALLNAVAVVIRSGFSVLGITPLEELK